MKNKDAYYFSHDSNARNDQKIMKLRLKHGILGYGIYFCIIEMLRETKNYQLPMNWEVISYDIRCDTKIIEDIVLNYQLFDVDNENQIFWSDSLKRRMFVFEANRTKLSIAGIKGNKIRWRSPGDPKAIALKESKVNKVKKITTTASNNGGAENAPHQKENTVLKNKSVSQKAYCLFLDRYKLETERDYVPAWGKHCKILKDIIKTISQTEYMTCLDNFFNDSYARDKNYDFNLFISQINRYRDLK